MADEFEDRIQSPNLRRIYEIWRSKCSDELLPRRADVDPVEFGKALPNVFLVEIQPTEPKLLLRVMGTAFEEQYGENVTGKYIEDLDFGAARDEILAAYDRLIESKEPVHIANEYEKSDGRVMRFERITLPLSDDGEIVTAVLGGIQAVSRRSEGPGQ